MILEETDHLENIRLKPREHLVTGHEQPRLRLSRLLKLLQKGNDPDQYVGKGTGTDKKRLLDEPSERESRKRAKLSEDTYIDRVDEKGEAERLVQMYRRHDEYRTFYLDDDAAEKCGWWLSSHVPTGSDPFVVDLGTSSVRAKVLLALPEMDYDLRSYAFRVLATSGRARLRAHTSLLVMPRAASVPERELPFILRVQVDCSYVCPEIFKPISEDKSQPDHAKASAIQDAQRRLLLFTCPSQRLLPEGYRGATDIPLLLSVLRPAPPVPSTHAHDAVQPEHLLPTLLPFQRRSVAWMLDREGKVVTTSGVVVPKSDADVLSRPLPLFWEEFQVSSEETWYVNRLRGIVSSTRPVPEDDELNEDALGGIVAEEPGLGKTLECISTILLNPAGDRSPSNTRWDHETKINVKEIKTTLIVTPPSLASQWADELAAHAPTLKVLVYDGWQKVKVPITQQDVAVEREKRLKQKVRSKAKVPSTNANKMKREPKVDGLDVDEVGRGDNEDHDVQDWCTYANTFDVCITTYSVLQHDLCVARPPPKRPRRAYVDYGDTSRARSPLVMCEWYRVIMDEVQMVGGGKTECVVTLFPYLVIVCMAKSATSVLLSRFLRVKAVTESPRAWARLLLPGYVHEFAELFRRYSVRTTKEAVKNELTIPQQTRYLVPIELGPVQRHVYDQQLDDALLDLGLDAMGVAATENWEVDVGKLRLWLRKLRGICTHPQVGQLAAHGADKLHKPGVLKSMAEVLEDMREQNWKNYTEDWKLKVSCMATLAQLLQQDESNRNRYREALETLLNAEKDGQNLVTDLSDALAEHLKEGEKLKAETARLREERQQAWRLHYNGNINGKGKGRARSDPPEHENVDADDEGLPRNKVGEAHRGKTTMLLSRTREARIVLHKVKFLQGDVYHVLGEQYESQENEAYASAEELRRALLRGTEEAAERAMTYLDHDPAVKALSEKDLFIEIPYLGKGGIKSYPLIEEANELIKDLLNEQSKLLWQWRTKLITLLTQPLGSKDQDADGQEYTRSLDTQGEAEAYLQAYAALLADRRETLTAERTLLAAHDVREVKARKTKAARGTRYGESEAEGTLQLDKLDDHDVQPEHQVMLKTLNDERKALLEDFDPGRAVKSIMVELNNIAIGIMREEDPERVIAKDATMKLRSLIASQGKLIDKLYADLAHFRKAFNERISYFRQLQEISDTVAEAEWEGSVKDAIQENLEQQTVLETNINTARARRRYLENLSKSHNEGTLDEDDKTCILCKCAFIRGYITQCAHVYCEDCLKAWLARAGGKACPVCRVSIDVHQLQRFVVEEQSTEAPARIFGNGESIPRSRREIHYNSINPQTLEEIKAMEAYGSYGSKIETLIRHLLYLDVRDPGTKSIVFSAWADSLLIIQHALQTNGISCLRIDQNTGKQNAAKKFRTDPSISVLLLHGERENAGLNVTCASRVFLVESVVHHAFEVQAIARIDRMGQTKPTEVYCYYAEDTVERNILDLAAKQGLSLYTREKAAGTLNATPFTVNADRKQVDAPAKKMQKGDFVYKVDDMLAIFFPHMYEDVEYLLPPEESVYEELSSSAGPQRTVTTVVQENAVAGPSRFRG
ncbi:SNF2 family N-terminal domain-containing protein [Trametes maxima]|nr:SNF2 family N-terminal domain-containing protein [Trametes maxima]